MYRKTNLFFSVWGLSFILGDNATLVVAVATMFVVATAIIATTLVAVATSVVYCLATGFVAVATSVVFSMYRKTN